MAENKVTKMTDADDVQKIELRREIKAQIDQLDALYDVERVKHLDLYEQVRHAREIGAGNDEATHSMERELALVQKTRRIIGDQTSCKRQELRDVDGPTLEEEYAAAHQKTQARHRELSDQIVSAHRALAKLAGSGKSQTEEATALRGCVEDLQEKRTEVESELADVFKEIEAQWRDAEQRTTLIGVSNLPKPAKGLIRQRHPNRDFFLADMFDYAMKDDGASMEAPIFTLSTKPDLSIWDWKSKDGNKSIKVTPSVLGRATQHDKDVLIYVVSQLTEALNRGRDDAKNRTVRFTVHDFLVTTNRQTSGEGYKLLQEAFERLRGTSINTDIKTGGQRIKEGFGIIDRWKIIDKSPADERMVAVEVTLSEWLYNAVSAFEVLTIHPDYFRLRKPLARRLYEIARKHCGHQTEWTIGLALLQEKTGSKSTLKEFRRAIRAIESDDSLPEYRMMLTQDDKVKFYVRDGGRLIRGITKRVGEK
nr:replication initiator protein A [Polaromonas sp. E19S]